MREILFRGKRIDNDDWIQGYLFNHWGRSYILWGAINDSPARIEVYPETVGQYTGMTDRNGNKIFEGDTVFAWSQGIHAKGSIGQRIDGYWIMYPSYQEGIMWYLVPDSDGRTSIEIIGNIHDKEENEND